MKDLTEFVNRDGITYFTSKVKSRLYFFLFNILRSVIALYSLRGEKSV